MIITNVCLLLEMLSIVICLHHLYGEKFKLDIDTVCLLAIDMIMMQVIDYFGWSSIWSVLIYPIITIYCGRKFGFQLKRIILNIVICVLLIGIIQIIVTFSFCCGLRLHELSDIHLLFTSGLVFLIVLFGISKDRFKKLFFFFQNKEKMLIISIAICVVLVLTWLVGYKSFRLLEAYQAIMLFICIILLLLLLGKLVKYRIKAKEIETELRMHKLYADSFEGLIENIRLKQHEFDNHINTIYSQHYVHDSYEKLVNAQKKYCELIMNENRFNKLLLGENPIIAGFLYGKFVEIEKMGIEVTYKIDIGDFDIKIPIYKIIELLGDLINNAVEALCDNKSENKLYVSIEEINSFSIEIRNTSPFIEYKEIETFFTKNYSKKGENRGLGLYNVKQICKEYQLNIVCDNKDIEGENWLSFQIMKEGTI